MDVMDDRVEIEMEITTMFSVNARKRKTIYVDRAEWFSMSQCERERYMDEEMAQFVAEQICTDWFVV